MQNRPLLLSEDSLKLCFDPSEFSVETFDPAVFVATKRRQGFNVDVLKRDLHHFAAFLQDKVVNLSKTELYDSFLSVSKRLRGVERRIDALREPLPDIRLRAEASSMKRTLLTSDITTRLRRIAVLQRQKQLLAVALRVRSLAVEVPLLASAIDDSPPTPATLATVESLAAGTRDIDSALAVLPTAAAAAADCDLDTDASCLERPAANTRRAAFSALCRAFAAAVAAATTPLSSSTIDIDAVIAGVEASRPPTPARATHPPQLPPLPTPAAPTRPPLPSIPNPPSAPQHPTSTASSAVAAAGAAALSLITGGGASSSANVDVNDGGGLGGGVVNGDASTHAAALMAASIAKTVRDVAPDVVVSVLRAAVDAVVDECLTAERAIRCRHSANPALALGLVLRFFVQRLEDMGMMRLLRYCAPGVSNSASTLPSSSAANPHPTDASHPSSGASALTQGEVGAQGRFIAEVVWVPAVRVLRMRLYPHQVPPLEVAGPLFVYWRGFLSTVEGLLGSRSEVEAFRAHPEVSQLWQGQSLWVSVGALSATSVTSAVAQRISAAWSAALPHPAVAERSLVAGDSPQVDGSDGRSADPSGASTAPGGAGVGDGTGAGGAVVAAAPATPPVGDCEAFVKAVEEAALALSRPTLLYPAAACRLMRSLANLPFVLSAFFSSASDAVAAAVAAATSGKAVGTTADELRLAPVRLIAAAVACDGVLSLFAVPWPSSLVDFSKIPSTAYSAPSTPSTRTPLGSAPPLPDAAAAAAGGVAAGLAGRSGDALSPSGDGGALTGSQAGAVGGRAALLSDTAIPPSGLEDTYDETTLAAQSPLRRLVGARLEFSLGHNSAAAVPLLATLQHHTRAAAAAALEGAQKGLVGLCEPLVVPFVSARVQAASRPGGAAAVTSSPSSISTLFAPLTAAVTALPPPALSDDRVVEVFRSAFMTVAEAWLEAFVAELKVAIERDRSLERIRSLRGGTAGGTKKHDSLWIAMMVDGEAMSSFAESLGSDASGGGSRSFFTKRPFSASAVAERLREFSVMGKWAVDPEGAARPSTPPL